MPKRKSGHLTQDFVDALTADSAKECWFPDDRFEGFGVRTRPNGTCTYELRWRDGQRQMRHKICRIQDQKLEAVLEHVRTDLFPSKIRKGKDVSALRREENAAVASLYDVYLDLMAELDAKQRSDGYINTTARLWHEQLRTSLGDELVQTVTREQLEQFLEPLADHPSLSAPVRSLITRLFKLAVKLGYRDDNPAIALTKSSGTVHRDVLTPQQMALIRSKGRDYTSPEAYDRVIFMMEAGVRPVELAHMTWADVDLANGVWTRKKGRGEVKAEVITPLSAIAVSILRRRKEQGCDRPFDKHNTRRAWARLKLELGLGEQLRPYDVPSRVSPQDP